MCSARFEDLTRLRLGEVPQKVAQASISECGCLGKPRPVPSAGVENRWVKKVCWPLQCELLVGPGWKHMNESESIVFYKGFE